MDKEDDERFVRVELPNALRVIYARAITKPTLARKLVFDHFRYAGRDADKGSSEADILKALAFCFELVVRMLTTIRPQLGGSSSSSRALSNVSWIDVPEPRTFEELVEADLRRAARQII